jgi:alkylated DNA repair dioxygenase AlkB
MAFENATPPQTFLRQDVDGNRFYCTSPDIDLPGLRYIPNFVTEEEENEILDLIEHRRWFTALKGRRQQHYGIVYYHTRHNLAELQPTQHEDDQLSGTMDDFSILMDRMAPLFPKDHPPTQCLVNEYTGVQAIRRHVDNVDCFGDIVCGLSLRDPVWMILRSVKNPDVSVSFLCERRSMYVWTDEVRFEWRHGITPHKQVYLPETNEVIRRDENYKRISLTFREIKTEGTKKVGSDDPQPDHVVY